MRLGWIATTLDTQHDDFDDVEGQGAIPIIHDQDITVSEARLSLDVGLTARFGASLVLPFRVVSTRIRYLDGGGTSVDLVNESTHHRNETLNGIADPMLLGSYARSGFTVRLGASLPIGRTENDPFMNDDVPHQHIQLGTGTVNPVLSLSYGYTFGKWRASGVLFTQQSFYENSKGYYPGDRYAAGVSLRRALGPWSVRGGLEVQGETYERWNGVRYTEEGNQGRIDAMVAAGASYAMTADLSIDLALKVPFINHVVGGQLNMPALLEIGASYAFGKAAPPPAAAHEDEHEHGDEHGDEHAEHGQHGDGTVVPPLDMTGADVADLGSKGSAVELTPVPGKITIFDFWAPWCVPCKTLEPALVEMAKANPSGIALRRIDIVDWETPVVAQHLTPKGFSLPHVKIYSATGELVFEQSSGPGKLQSMIESIRALAGNTAHITVDQRGFSPANVTVPRGVPVTLRFTRTSAKGCGTEVLMTVDGKPIKKDLPLDQPVELTLTFSTAGVINYACAMDMMRGTITVR